MRPSHIPDAVMPALIRVLPRAVMLDRDEFQLTSHGAARLRKHARSRTCVQIQSRGSSWTGFL